jgi:regulator of cell morphogenesis and NO signaling
MMIAENKTIADLVTEAPGRARVFEKYGIDYCCGGKRPLEEVCAQQNIPIENLTSELQAADAGSGTEDSKNWSEAGITNLVDHIESVHHGFLNRELPRLSSLAQKVAKVHGENRPELIELSSVFHSMKDELEQHSFKEEQVLFPMCRQLETATQKPQFHCGSVHNPISVMESEHDDLGVALTKMRELTSDYLAPDDACTSYKVLFAGLLALEKDLHMHIHEENNILFPTVKAAEARLS